MRATVFNRAVVALVSISVAMSFITPSATAAEEDLPVTSTSVVPPEPPATPSVPAALIAAAREHGTVRVIIELATDVVPESQLRSVQATVDQRAAIVADQGSVARLLAGTGSVVGRRYTTLAMISATVTPEGLDRLRSSPLVAHVSEDTMTKPNLNGTAGIIEADDMWSSGYDGSGWTVVIIDTGIDRSHPMFSNGSGGSRVVNGACFSTTYPSEGLYSVCPGGGETEYGAAAGVHCNVSNSLGSQCEHGTHVAGIAAGGTFNAGGTSIKGIAPKANIISLQVFTAVYDPLSCGHELLTPCTGALVSDQMAALDYVNVLRSSYRIASVNMSLGGNATISSCAAAPQATAINTLHSNGIATVVSSGNDGWDNAVSSPACVPKAVSVGSTTNGDMVSIFTSTDDTLVDLYAPGSAILSATPGNGYASWNGTSMAAPHVAGAYALMRQAFDGGALTASPSTTVDNILNLFKSTGTPVRIREADPDYPALFPAYDLGFSHPRLNIAQAFAAGTSRLTVAVSGTGAGSVVSDVGGINCPSGSCSLTHASGTYVLTATPGPESTFAGWSGGGCSGTGTCTISRLINPTTVTARFTLDPPANDNFAAASALTGALAGRNTAATDQAGEPVPSCVPSAAKSVWYTYTAPADGVLTLATAGSTFDTVLGVYTGSTLGGLTEVGCNDDESIKYYGDSEVLIGATAGTTYRVQVTGYQGATGSISISASLDTANRLLTTSVSGPGWLNVYYPTFRYCPVNCAIVVALGAEVEVTAHTEGLDVFDGWGGDCSGIVSPCRLTMSSSRSINAHFTAVRPPNDEPADAYTLTPGTTQTQSIDGATGDGSGCDADGAGAVWYRWTPSVSGILELSTEGSDYSTVLTPHVGSDPNDLRWVSSGCTYRSSTWTNEPLQFEVDAGETYYFQIHVYDGSYVYGPIYGNLVLNSTFTPGAVVANDMFAQAMNIGSLVEGVPRIFAQSTVNSGVEPGEPAPPCQELVGAFRSTVWFSWTAAATGILEIHTLGSDFDTMLAVYTGASMSGMANVACNDDANAEEFQYWSHIRGMRVESGTTYYVQVAGWDIDGYDGGEGQLLLTFELGAQLQAVSLSPVRLLDTRPGFRTVDGVAQGSGWLVGGRSLSLRVAGRGGVPADASAVSLNLAAVSPQGGGYLSVFPRSASSGCSQVPNASIVNYGAGVDLANAFTVPVGADGSVCVFSWATTHLIADVLGFVPDGVDSSLSPVRLLDTRPGFRTVDGVAQGSGWLVGGRSLSLRVAGRGGVPADASAVSLNLAAVSPQGGGYLSVFPRSASSGCSQVPNASIVNYGAGVDLANAFTVPVGADGSVCVFSWATTHLIVDVLGYAPGG